MTMADNIIPIFDGQERRRRRAIAEFHERREAIGRHNARLYNRRIPPPLNPCHAGWVALLIDGYRGLLHNTQRVNQTLAELSATGKLHTSAMLAHLGELSSAIDAALAAAEDWRPGDDSKALTPELHRIADHAKHVYAVGARDISDLQYMLERLAYTGCIDIEAHNELQHTVCYDLGEAIYTATTSNLHDDELWDGGWDGDDDTYSDGRQVMSKVFVPDWGELFEPVLRRDEIKVYGDGVISAFPEGMVCQIAPPNPQEDECWHPQVEISLATLLQRPWTNVVRDGK
ncbi:hypothetical protein OG921_15850 [Aldersonia sp. NBC_00410]|uniref:hypothetical protein n=1 Tax=Aldersonia sp. NBC_00410 TaxID=2975954 RepID=UPI00224FC161|nr:hypothetical protein [Aldersonia sp. NBC_00410]MCX5044643.1 hypothetical protein [Aldersonia sp. NBC_00410]